MRLQLNKLNILLVDFVLVVLLSDGSRTFHIDHNNWERGSGGIFFIATSRYSILFRLPTHRESHVHLVFHFSESKLNGVAAGNVLCC